MSESNEIDYKAKLSHYEKVLGTGDVATRAYKSVVKVLEQQVNFLESFVIKDKISNATKDDPVYERGIKIFEGMTDNVLKLNKLKMELGIEYVEKEEEVKPISAKSIANGE